MDHDLSKKFLTAYNELDAFMRKALNYGSNQMAEHTRMIQEMRQKNKLFLYYHDDLLAFARLRNAIVHNPYAKEVETIAEPHQIIVNRYQEIVEELKNPPKALSIAIKAGNIYTIAPDTNALEVMKIMAEKTYTHIPVVDGEQMIGVFSENTVFSYLVKHEDAIIDSTMKIKDFEEFLPVDKHRSEYFEFVPRDTLIVDIENIFEKGLKNIKRIAVVYITENGKPNEKLLGMITVWDLAGNIKR